MNISTLKIHGLQNLFFSDFKSDEGDDEDCNEDEDGDDVGDEDLNGDEDGDDVADEDLNGDEDGDDVDDDNQLQKRRWRR